MCKATKVGYRKTGRRISRDARKAVTVIRVSANRKKNPKNQYAIYVEQQENSEIDNALFTLRSLEKNSVGNQIY